MTRALIFGGTRFVGKSLVPLLLERGIDVTVATRGRVPVPFDESVRRITLERSDRESLKRGIGSSTWDLVYSIGRRRAPPVFGSIQRSSG